MSLPVRGRGLKHYLPAARPGRHSSLPVRGRGLKLGEGLGVELTIKSLPVRGRGLKHLVVGIDPSERMSLPVRGRGLKLKPVRKVLIVSVSLPVRGRGLKRHLPREAGRAVHVAPRAGARIETLASWRQTKRRCVAPRAGARIETLGHVWHIEHGKSLPVRGRGLKHRK